MITSFEVNLDKKVYLCQIIPCCRLSGLIVDVFGDIAVIASSAAWVEKYRPEVEACIRKINDINHVKWRPSFDILKEEGIDVSNFKEMLPSTCPERTKVSESSKDLMVADIITFLMQVLLSTLMKLLEVAVSPPITLPSSNSLLKIYSFISINIILYDPNTKLQA